MERVQIKEYAERRGITLSSAYSQIKSKKYEYLQTETAEDGLPHITREKINGKSVFVLDDYAIRTLTDGAKIGPPINVGVAQDIADEQQHRIEELTRINQENSDLVIELMTIVNMYGRQLGLPPYVIDGTKYPSLPVANAMKMLPVSDMVYTVDPKEESRGGSDPENDSKAPDSTPENVEVKPDLTDSQDNPEESRVEPESDVQPTDSEVENPSEDAAQNGSEDETSAAGDRKDESFSLLKESLAEMEQELSVKQKELEELEAGFHPFKRRRKQAEINTLIGVREKLLKKLAGI